MDTPVDIGDIYPSLTYRDAQGAIDWLQRVFGFRLRLLATAGGQIAHSELTLGRALVMVSSPKAESGRVPPDASSSHGHGLSIWVADPDAHHARARSEGAEIVRELRDEEYGGRGYMAKDPEGHLWYFGTYRPGSWWKDDGPNLVEH